MPSGSGTGLLREKRTIEAMVEMYCRARHGAVGGSCQECSELLDYAGMRLDKCPFGGSKPACAKCPVHCYNPSMRARIVSVMRYSGPRMISKHPVLALRHLMSGRRDTSERAKT